MEDDIEMLFLDSYNTKLTPQEEAEFLKWAKERSKLEGRNILMDLGAYDVRGFWKSKDYEKVKPGQHGFDTWKKPNHPTFSDQSVYHKSVLPDGTIAVGGHWTNDDQFILGDSNMNIFGVDNLKNYMNKFEPQIKLVVPKGKSNSNAIIDKLWGMD